MPDVKLFEAVNKNINKCEVRLENYVIPSLQTKVLTKTQDSEITNTESNEETKITTKETKKKEKPDEKRKQSLNKVEEETPEEKLIRIQKETTEKFAVFAEKQEILQPKLCMWLYMPREEVQSLLKLTSKQKIRDTIDNKIELEYPKGISRILAIELIYSVVRFCQKCEFNAKQSGTLLSIFYLTHHYFLSSFYTTAEKTYRFFKEYMLLHCFECPPDSMELFSYKESTHVAQYFCSLYLRNLPLIRLLTLPNFGFYLNYEKKPDPFEEIGKKGKGKKGEDKKGKKGTEGSKKSKK